MSYTTASGSGDPHYCQKKNVRVQHFMPVKLGEKWHLANPKKKLHELEVKPTFRACKPLRHEITRWWQLKYFSCYHPSSGKIPHFWQIFSIGLKLKPPVFTIYAHIAGMSDFSTSYDL